MVTFCCKRSGNCISFMDEGDIISTRLHEGYEEITNRETDNGLKKEIIKTEENADETTNEEVLIVSENMPISKEVGILSQIEEKIVVKKHRGRPAKK